MRAVLQRVTSASVTVADETVGQIGPGLVALVAATDSDTSADVATIARKIAELRILRGDDSVAQTGAEVLLISQFTLYGDTRKGRRPSWSKAARGDVAEPLLAELAGALRARGVAVATGSFGADMAVALVNDGPVTLIVDT